jgi:hypothetical protein
MNHYVLVGDEQKGPYDMEQLKWMWKTGQITAETSYWREGLTQWIPLGVMVSDAIAAESRIEAQKKAAPAVQPKTEDKDPEPTTFENIIIVIFALFFSVFAMIVGVVLRLLGRKKSGTKMIVWGLLFSVIWVLMAFSGAF